MVIVTIFCQARVQRVNVCAALIPQFAVVNDNKNLAIANRSRVSCTQNTLRAFIGLNITP